MCGRYVAARATSDWVPLFDVEHESEDLPGPSYNIAPTQQVRIVMDSKDGRRLASARWSFVPGFKKSLRDGPTPFNSRSETVASSRMFAPAFKKQRAIIPASGFYERVRTGERPSYFIHPDDDATLAFAGLYTWWKDPAKAEDDPSRWVLSTTIITRSAQGPMVDIHDREPLYLDPELWDEWLDPATQEPTHVLNAALEASSPIADALDYRRVGPGWLSTARGSKIDAPELITPA